MSYRIGKEKEFELGRKFEAGLIDYESLTGSEKVILNKYYLDKNERIDERLTQVESSLMGMESRLDKIYNNLLNIQ
jgi:hypothetical protein